MISARLEAIVPPLCMFCGLRTGDGHICERCMRVLPWNECYCERCGQPVPARPPDGVPCAACQLKPPVFTKARAPLRYSFPVDVSLKKLKFRRQTTFAVGFADLLLPVLQSEFGECDTLVPVPLHWWRQVRRGFNQADELCRWLSANSGLPVSNNMVRQRATRSQSGLNALQRSRNLQGAFTKRGGACCRFPLIIDDVITTGTTCSQLTVALLDAGARDVGVLAVARSGATC